MHSTVISTIARCALVFPAALGAPFLAADPTRVVGVAASRGGTLRAPAQQRVPFGFRGFTDDSDNETAGANGNTSDSNDDAGAARRAGPQQNNNTSSDEEGPRATARCQNRTPDGRCRFQATGRKCFYCNWGEPIPEPCRRGRECRFHQIGRCRYQHDSDSSSEEEAEPARENAFIEGMNRQANNDENARRAAAGREENDANEDPRMARRVAYEESAIRRAMGSNCRCGSCRSRRDAGNAFGVAEGATMLAQRRLAEERREARGEGAAVDDAGAGENTARPAIVNRDAGAGANDERRASSDEDATPRRLFRRAVDSEGDEAGAAAAERPRFGGGRGQGLAGGRGRGGFRGGRGAGGRGAGAGRDENGRCTCPNCQRSRERREQEQRELEEAMRLSFAEYEREQERREAQAGSDGGDENEAKVGDEDEEGAAADNEASGDGADGAPSSEEAAVSNEDAAGSNDAAADGAVEVATAEAVAGEADAAAVEPAANANDEAEVNDDSPVAAADGTADDAADNGAAPATAAQEEPPIAPDAAAEELARLRAQLAASQAEAERLQQQNQEFEEQNEARQCKVCYDRFADSMFTPCNHGVCQQCMGEIRRRPVRFGQRRSCPFCREVIRGTATIIFS